MKTVLSGIQPSGKIHLGNYLGATKQHIEMQKEHNCIYFIADLHALTTIRNAEAMKKNTIEIAMAYIALGLDTNKTIFFKQSEVSEHSELCWIFDCITPMPFIERAHAWKDAKAKGKKDPTVGLFNYPILQAADILLYKPDLVPVGQDQKQHIEMTRDIAQNFNNTFGETFKLPDPYIKDEVATVPGTDGQKMSKSYGNTIDIFESESVIKKQVMSIVTSSIPVEDPKDPKSCNVFKLYKLLATPEETKEMEDKYISGGYGYGDAKKELLNKILEHFKQAREKYSELESKENLVMEILNSGSTKAKVIAKEHLKEIKSKIGYL
ncbi:tryptophan--tRNA ligase [Candidatus Peregrinibacteria bacterium CG10_big_fil_rev_8_21_14_0_10_36_19]|nr:MAG: tryptophan--tRNA ligase [Candidatus Peregrinibacteria bacterium CG10_big_fil_rev_8_21_14_0_10_36_19]